MRRRVATVSPVFPSLLRRRTHAAPLLLAALSGLSCSAPPQPIVVPKVEVATAPAPPPPPPARWVDSEGATLVGPEVEGGTMVLLGGRRALLGKDGKLRGEAKPAPEPIQELVEVPAGTGARLVARGEHGVYRLDDPLGEPVSLARVDGSIAHVGAGPGVVAVWTSRADVPVFLDVEHGEPKSFPRLPELPLRAIAFLDDKRGAAVFEAVGLAVTVDGGASWKVAAESSPGDALRVSGLRRREGALFAYAHADGPEGAIDLASARLGHLDPRPAASGGEGAALLRWIRATGRDPLEVAAAMGVDHPAGGVLVASHGLAARVDPRSGAILDLAEFARGKWLSPCNVSGAGQAAWIGCTLAEDQAEGNVYDPYGVIRLVLEGQEMKLGRPEIVRNGEVDLRVSPSGGVMLLGACKPDEEGQACVRQPDGAWKTFTSDVDLGERGAGPLADGRVAFLRGVTDGDEPPAAEGSGGRLHVAVIDTSGKEHALGPIPFTPSRGFVRVQSPIEEDADHTLRFVIEDGEGPFAVIQPPGKDAATAQKIPDVTVARIHAGRGLALGESKVLASLDGGSTWNEVPVPSWVLKTLGQAPSFEETGGFVVSAAGAKVASMLRLGWGPAEAGDASEERPQLRGVEIAAPRLPPSPPDRALVCKSEGPSPGVPPLLGTAQVSALFGVKPPPTGTRRGQSQWSPGRSGMLDTVALFEEQGPDKPGQTPATWTFRWHDPQEVGGRVRTASGPAPKGAPWSTNLRFAASRGDRALFLVRGSDRLRLVRVRPKLEVIDLPPELTPSGEVTFGTERGEPIAWIHDTQVIAWVAGEAPRAIARISTHPVRSLGEPTRDGVPLWIGSNDWSLLRTIPIPPLDKREAKPPPPAPPSLDGWARAPVLRRDLGSLPACGARPKGARFSISRSSLHAEIDGLGESGHPALYDVRVGASEACTEGIAAALSPDRRVASPPPAPPGGKKKPASQGVAAFVRVDLAAKRAEGGDRGVAPAAVRRMSCALGPKP